MQRRAALSFAVLLGASALSSARADCICRAPGGVVAHHGETLCLRSPSGLRLARCGMSENVSSWTFLPDPCPQASRMADGKVAELAPAVAGRL